MRRHEGSPRALEVAGSTRKRLELEGLALSDARACEADGADGTRLAGCAKVYLPLGEAAASERPFGLVVQLARDEQRELVWVFVAFGPRHPRPGCGPCTDEPTGASTGVSLERHEHQKPALLSIRDGPLAAIAERTRIARIGE